MIHKLFLKMHERKHLKVEIIKHIRNCFLIAATLLMVRDQLLYSQTIKSGNDVVGILLIQFNDYSTNDDEKGSIGWKIINGNWQRQVDMYSANNYHNIVFNENGIFPHPDSADHDFARYYGSLNQFYKECSYGNWSVIPPYSNSSGIINKIVNGKVIWITVDQNKNDNVNDYSTWLDNLMNSAYSKACDQFDSQNITEDIRNYSNVILMYAGVAPTTIPGYSTNGHGIKWEIVSEKIGIVTEPHNAVLTGLSPLAHEYGHTIFNVADYNKFITTHYTVMGGRSSYARDHLLMPHLDPWMKLQAGWLEYQIVNNETRINPSLPVIERYYNNGRPFVYIVPIDVNWGSTPDWVHGHYLIIENRRAESFDQYINRVEHGEHTFDPNHDYSDVIGNGGFVVWEYDNRLLGDRLLSVVEADGNYAIRLTTDAGGTPNDFFNNKTFASWTKPSTIEHIKDDGNPEIVKDWLPPIYIKFPAYNTAGDHNDIDVIAVGPLYSNTDDAMKGNNQRKISSSSSAGLSSCYFIKSDPNDPNGITMGANSTDGGYNWRYSCLNSVQYSNTNLINKTGNFPSTCYFGGSSYFVWQENTQGNLYDIKAGISGNSNYVKTIASGILCSTNNSPTPVIASSGNLGIIVFASAQGLYLSESTNGGNDWSTNPIYVNPTNGNSKNPSIAISSSYKVLAYEEENKIYMNVINSTFPLVEASKSLNELLPEYNRKPSVDLRDNFVQIVWETKSIVPNYTDKLENVVHAPIELSTSFDGTVNLLHLFGRKYNADENITNPIIASVLNTNYKKDAQLFWIASSSGGSRMRYNTYHNEAGKHKWFTNKPGFTTGESVLSEVILENPSLCGINNGTNFIVRYGNQSPYSLVSNIDDQRLPMTGYTVIPQIDISRSTRRAAKLIIDQPTIIDSGNVIRRYDYEGIPDANFNGRITGISIDSLTRTELMHLINCQTVITGVEYAKNYQTLDTVRIKAFLVDTLNSIITESDTLMILPQTIDTTFSIVMELSCSPQNIYAKSYLSVWGGPIDSTDRELSVTQIYFFTEDSTNTYPKKVPIVTKSQYVDKKLLLYNYPNPFNPSTNIFYTIAEGGFVKLTLYDYLGREIETLIDGIKSSGTYNVNFSGQNHPSGIYYCRLYVNGVSTIYKIALIK